MAQDVRTGASATLSGAAYHCSYCFRTISQFVAKIEALAHQELNRPDIKNASNILRAMQTGQVMWNGMQLESVEVTAEDVPAFVLNNPHRFVFLLNRTTNPHADFTDDDRYFST